MNQFYDHARQRATDTGLGWPSGNIKAALVTAAYTPNIATDNFLSTISGIGGAILSRSGNFTTKTNTGGVLNADPITFSLVASGSVGKYVIISRHRKRFDQRTDRGGRYGAELPCDHERR